MSLCLTNWHCSNWSAQAQATSAGIEKVGMAIVVVGIVESCRKAVKTLMTSARSTLAFSVQHNMQIRRGCSLIRWWALVVLVVPSCDEPCTCRVYRPEPLQFTPVLFD
jgi:hypothetical protein